MLPRTLVAHGRLTPYFLPAHRLPENDDLLRAMIEAEPVPAQRIAHAELIAIRPVRGLAGFMGEVLNALTGGQTAPRAIRDI